jgi:VEFS-Box of polycomb protein
MVLEQVFSDRDSEDEVDDDIADFEDRRVSNYCLVLQAHNFIKLIYNTDNENVSNFIIKYLFLQMLDDFVDVTKDEKQIMHLWNSFVRKQRSPIFSY